MLIVISTIIFCLCKKKRKKADLPPQSPLETENELNNSSTAVNRQDIKIFTFIFETTSQNRIEILIESDKTYGELIESYFKKIKRPDLFTDKTITFLFSGNLIPKDSKDIIGKKYIDKKSKDHIYKIIVNDLDDKIKLNININ